MKDKSVVFIETCYRLYEQKMYAVAYRILKDRYLAEDVVQETFLKLMRKNVYFEDAESTECKGYLIKALKHSAIDIYRKREKEQEREFLSDDASEYEGETTGNHNRLMAVRLHLPGIILQKVLNKTDNFGQNTSIQVNG